MNDLPVTDPVALERLREWGGRELLVQMIRLYLENARKRSTQIDEGLASPDGLEEAERGAHSLKSSAMNVGALRVNRIAHEIESAAEQRDGERVRALREELRAALRDAETDLTRILDAEEG